MVPCHRTSTEARHHERDCDLRSADQGGQDRPSRELARYILTLGFDEEDQNRMQDLAERNQERFPIER